MLAIETYIFNKVEEMKKNMTEEQRNRSFAETMEIIRQKRKGEEKQKELRLKESRGRIW